MNFTNLRFFTKSWYDPFCLFCILLVGCVREHEHILSIIADHDFAYPIVFPSLYFFDIN